MNPLLRSNIQKSLSILRTNPKVPHNLITVVEEGNDVRLVSTKFTVTDILDRIAIDAFKPLPWFYKDNTKGLQSPQESFFGFYAIRNIVRGSFLGLRFLQAGDHLRSGKYIASSVLSYYTAAFHLLHGFLALEGRVFIGPVLGPPVITKSSTHASLNYGYLEKHPKAIVGILTRNNKWKFEPRTRSHSSHWRELESVFNRRRDNLPEYFDSFFDYLLSYGSSRHSDDNSFVQEGLKRFADVRHEAVYGGFGFDNFVYDELMNKDRYSFYGIDLKSKEYREFAVRLLADSLVGVSNIINSIKGEILKECLGKLITSVFTPPFEIGHLKLGNIPKELGEKIQSLSIWMVP
jgi:hypothetical protein